MAKKLIISVLAVTIIGVVLVGLLKPTPQVAVVAQTARSGLLFRVTRGGRV